MAVAAAVAAARVNCELSDISFTIVCCTHKQLCVYLYMGFTRFPVQFVVLTRRTRHKYTFVAIWQK